jgi:hypothetical protein
MNQDNIILSEIYQVPKDNYHMKPVILELKNDIMDAEE